MGLDIERHLDRIRPHVRDPRLGIFGPDSMLWTVSREHSLILGGGRAILLQTAHPFVAYGVHEHSDFRSDPAARGRRTFAATDRMGFGDLDTAFTAARRVARMHERVRGNLPVTIGRYPAGTPYDADQQQAALWVWATLIDTSALTFQQVVRPLTARERERYYEEARVFAYLFGVEPETLPPTWDDFQDYCDGMFHSDALAVDHVARGMADFFERPVYPWMAPAMPLFKAVTTHLLPAPVRDMYGLPYGDTERAIAVGVLSTARTLLPYLPAHVRFNPAYMQTLWRLQGRSGSDPTADAVQRVLYGKRPRAA